MASPARRTPGDARSVGLIAGNHVTLHVDMPPASTGQVHLILDVTGYVR